MGYRIREVTAEDKFSRALSMEALARAIPQATITTVLGELDAEAVRERKLTMTAVVLVLIAMNLATHLPIDAVLRHLGRGLRFIWPDPEIALPGKSALSYRRYQLGARPLVALFQRVCQPLTTPATPGAYLFGLRLMAIDGTVEDVPDTPANARAFGRHSGGRGQSAFPQVLGVYLVECGSHAVVDAGFWPCQTSERVGGHRLLRAVGPGMLVMWDRNFHSYDMVAAARRRGAQVLGRLPAGVQPTPVRPLADGSQLVYLHPGDERRRDPDARLLVRLITYTLTDPARPGYGEVHRLVTTLLEPAAAPAVELACAYHERWEIEVTVDEIDTHQRLAGRPLRSRRPVGVIQELYALLLAHYAVRALMHEAACQAGADPDRLSFVHAVRVIRDAIPEFQMAAPQEHPRLYARLLRDIAAGRLPPRRQRTNPRVVKRKMSKFPLKRDEHRHPPQPAGPFREAVALI
jgi:hypothetical protein